MNKTEIKKIMKEIKSISYKLSYYSQTKISGNYYKELLQTTKQESKDHDRFRFNAKRGMSINDESVYFAVKRVCEYLYIADNYLRLEDYNHTQKSCYIAYALVHQYKADLKNIITQEQALNIIELDYVEMINAGV